VLAPLTLQIPNAGVTFESQGEDLRVSRIQLYGRVSGLTGRTVYEFDDEIVSQLTREQYQAQRNSTSIYNRPLRLPPGRFKLGVVLKDTVADKMGVVEQGISVPVFPEGKLAASPVILTSELAPVSDDELRKDAFAFGRFRVRPRLDATFHKGEYLGAYLEIYNAAVDPSKGKPSLRVEYQIEPKGQPPSTPRDVSRSAVPERDLVSLPLFVDISAHPPGPYTVVFRITDLVQNTTTASGAPFRIAP